MTKPAQAGNTPASVPTDNPEIARLLDLLEEAQAIAAKHDLPHFICVEITPDADCMGLSGRRSHLLRMLERMVNVVIRSPNPRVVNAARVPS